MRIVIAGNGKVGYALAVQLSKEGHDVTVIDNNESIHERSQEQLDIMTVLGNGASLETQREASVGDAELFIAATSADEINLLCCILARKLGCKQTVARVRNPAYTEQMRFLKDDLGLSMTVSPDRSSAHAIFRVLQFPSFLKLDSFARGRVELVELSVEEGGALDGIALFNLYEIAKVKLLVCCVDRDGEVIIPRGSFVLKKGDKISVTAATRDLAQLIRNLSITSHRVKNVVICGGSLTAELLAAELIESRINVKILSHNRERCLHLSEALPKAIVLCCDYKDEDLLRSESIGQADAFIALTDYEEDNIVLSLLAERMGAKKAVASVDRAALLPLLQGKGSISIISPKYLAINEILRFVRALDKSSGGSMLTLHSIMEGRAEALEFHVSSDVRHLGEPLSKLPTKKDLLIACITRHGKIIIPNGDDFMLEDDTVVIVTKAGDVIYELNDIFAVG